MLSAEQVGYWFEQYQRDSYRRADALERQKKARADDNAEDLPLHYPGRSYPDSPQSMKGRFWPILLKNSVSEGLRNS